MGWAEFLFSFNGRIGRARYWLLWVIYLVAYVAGSGVIVLIRIGVIAGSAMSPDVVLMRVLGLVGLAWVITVFIAEFSIAIRRLHDRNKSAAWLMLFVLVPLILLVLAGADMEPGSKVLSPTGAVLVLIGFGLTIWGFVEIGCLRGTAGTNEYGEDPNPSPDKDMVAVFE